MEPLILSPQTIEEFTLSDARLVGIRWQTTEPHVMFDLVLGDGQSATLRCAWAAPFEVDLTWPERHGGAALSWQCHCERRGGRWNLVLDLGNRGCIQVECQEARLDLAASPGATSLQEPAIDSFADCEMMFYTDRIHVPCRPDAFDRALRPIRESVGDLPEGDWGAIELIEYRRIPQAPEAPPSAKDRVASTLVFTTIVGIGVLAVIGGFAVWDWLRG